MPTLLHMHYMHRLGSLHSGQDEEKRGRGWSKGVQLQRGNGKIHLFCSFYGPKVLVESVVNYIKNGKKNLNHLNHYTNMNVAELPDCYMYKMGKNPQ